MISKKFAAARTTIVGLSLALASVCFISGCKGKASKSATAPAPSGSAAGAQGPCGQYAAKVCDKAGSTSSTCSSFKEATDLMSPTACTAGLKEIDFSLKKLTNLRSECDKLVKTLCDAVGPKTKTCDMVTTQTKQFPAERCKTMQAQVPQIIQELNKMEAANKPLPADLQAAIADSSAPSFGPNDAKVKLVEFSDFECPFCSRAASVVTQIKQKYGDKVLFVFRQFPLPMHSHAREAAQASLAAHEQGKFWEYHDRLFQNQGALDRASLENHAKQTGLDMAKFKKALDEKALGEKVDVDVKLGEKAAVQGTPTLFVNGARVENPTDFAAVAGMIDAALQGTPPG